MSRLNLKAVNFSKFPIRDRETGETIPLRPNRCQRKIIAVLDDLILQGKPLWIIILKARRIGSSTLGEVLLTIHCIVHANAKAMTVAHRAKNAKELFQHALAFHRVLAEALGQEFPATQHELTFPHQDGEAKHTLSTAKTIEGARGLTLSALLASEAAFYEQAEAVFTALLSTIQYEPNTMAIIESTANGKAGDGEAFYRMWQEAQEGRNNFTPIFISWLEDEGLMRPVAEGQGPYDDDEKELMKEYGATIEQIAWRRWAIPNRCQGSAEIFLQEYPHIPEVAFLTSGDPAFNFEEIKIVEKSVNSKAGKPKLIGFIEDDKEGEIRLVRRPIGNLKVWQHPIKGHKYYLGADAARGKASGDFSAAQLINGTTGQQAAAYGGRIAVTEFAHILYLLGHHYNKAMLNLEVTGGDGAHTQTILRDKYHYPNWYQWRGKDDKRQRGVMANPALGYETQWRSRQRLLVVFREVVRLRELEVYDKDVLVQMQNAMRDDPMVRWEVTEGHDDAFMAMMLAVIAWSQYPPPKLIGTVVNLIDRLEGQQEEFNWEPEWAEKLRARAIEMSHGGKPAVTETLEGI